MKISRLFGVFLFMGIGTVAKAQSSVTLSGIIDQGLNYTSNADGHSAVAMHSGSMISSFWNLSGREDLGGGYRAVFNLQGGFDASNGAATWGNLWSYQSYVGLGSDSLGSLTFGRQFDPTLDLYSPLTATGGWAGDVAMLPFDNDNSVYDFQVSNSVKYTSPVVRGFKLEAMYGFSNVAGNFADNRLYGAAIQYQQGGLTAALGFLHMTQPGDTTGAVSYDSVFRGSSQNNIVSAVNYQFGKLKLGAAYSHVRVNDPTRNNYFEPDATQLPDGSWKSWVFDNFQVQGTYLFTPYLMGGLSYTLTLAHLDSTQGNYVPKYHIVAAELAYFLSKRTLVYVQGSYQHIASADTGTDFDRATNYGAAGISSSGNMFLGRVGIMHKF